MCTSGTATGPTVIILSGSVPTSTANCYCDVTMNSPADINLNYDGPDFSNCFLEIKLADSIFGCDDGVVQHRLTSTSRLQLSKQSIYQLDWCLFIQDQSGNILI